MKSSTILSLAALAASMATASANVIYWDITSLTTGSPTGGSATGTIGGITASYTGEVGALSSTGAGVNYWVPDGAYVDNTVITAGPSTSDFIQLKGGSTSGINTVNFSQPVVDPVMLIVSLGQPNVLASFDFDKAPTLLHTGQGYWGNGPLSVTFDIANGNEGHGSIQFHGTFSSISWTNPQFENWYGFTLALPDQTNVPEVTSTFGLLGLGIGALAMARRRK